MRLASCRSHLIRMHRLTHVLNILVCLLILAGNHIFLVRLAKLGDRRILGLVDISEVGRVSPYLRFQIHILLEIVLVHGPAVSVPPLRRDYPLRILVDSRRWGSDHHDLTFRRRLFRPELLSVLRPDPLQRLPEHRSPVVEITGVLPSRESSLHVKLYHTILVIEFPPNKLLLFQEPSL